MSCMNFEQAYSEQFI